MAEPVNIVSYPDSPHFDAFGRLRISDTGQRLDVEFIYDKQPDLFDEVIGAGGGTVTHNANSRDLTLATGNVGVTYSAGMMSHPVPYTPGNSQMLAMTGTLDNAGVGGGTAQVFVRSKVSGSVVETVIDQSDWDAPNADVDWATSQIVEVDFQSLKVGRIRFFLNRGGVITKLHTITNDNVRAEGYWQLPNLPMCWRIYNDATYTYMEMSYGDMNNAIGIRYRVTANALATLRAICGTVKSEGGLSLDDLAGFNRTADMGVAEKTVSTTLIPLLSIRSKETFNSLENLGLSIPIDAGISSDNPIKVVVYFNSVLTGAVWSDVDTDKSTMEYDTTATAFTNGHVVHSGYVGAGKNVVTSGGALLGKTLLWDRKGSETGILTICAIKTGATDADVLASIRWKEIR